MSVNSTGSGCRSRAHHDDMAIYDSLPREVRDELKGREVVFVREEDLKP
jgi:hypothetical protein